MRRAPAGCRRACVGERGARGHTGSHYHYAVGVSSRQRKTRLLFRKRVRLCADLMVQRQPMTGSSSTQMPWHQ